MLKQLLNGRLFGHPVHPMLVHFPSALFPAAVLFEVMGLLGYGKSFYSASVYCVGLGLLIGLLAGLFGAVDYIKLGSSGNKKVFVKASYHAAIQLTVLTLFSVWFLLRYPSLENASDPGWIEILLSVFGLLLMFVGNYLGGDMVYSDRVGVRE